MSVAQLSTFLATATPPLTPEETSQLQQLFAQAAAADFDGASQMFDRVQAALRKRPNLDVLKKHGSTDTIKGMASFFDKQQSDVEQWATLRQFMSLREDTKVQKAFVNNLERALAHNNISSLIDTAFHHTRLNAIDLQNFIRTLQHRNTFASRLMEFSLRDIKPNDQRWVNAETCFKHRVQQLESSWDKLKKALSLILEHWKHIKSLLKGELDEWEKLGRARKALATKYRCYLTAIKISKSAKQTAEHYETMAKKSQDGAIAAQIIQETYKPLLDYATFFVDTAEAVDEDTSLKPREEAADDWRIKIKCEGEFTYEWICGEEKQKVEVMKAEIDASVEELQALATVAGDWYDALGKKAHANGVIGRATE